MTLVRIKSKEYKTAIIIGAGASRGAISALRPGNIKPPLNRDYFEMLNRFVKVQGGANRNSLERLNSFIDATFLVSQQSPTMEDVFNVLFMSKDFPEIFREKRGRVRKAGYRVEISDYISLFIKLFIYIQSNKGKRVNHYEKLVSQLSGKDTLISLNYDTLLDVALCEQGWQPELGYGFDAGNKIEYDNIQKRRSVSLAHVRLIKPHGSLNWFAKGSISQLDKVLSRRPPSKIIMSYVPRTYDIRRERLIRFFIPPLYTKFFNNKFWRRLWHYCYVNLRSGRMFDFFGLFSYRNRLSLLCDIVQNRKGKKK